MKILVVGENPSHAAGHASRSVAARMAAMDPATFDQLLIERRIPAYDEERWGEDLETLRHVTLLP